MTASQELEFVRLFEQVRQNDTSRHILMCCIMLEFSPLPKEDFPYLESVQNATQKEFEASINLAKTIQESNPALLSVLDRVITYIRREWIQQATESVDNLAFRGKKSK